jgi:hypothetical protein
MRGTHELRRALTQAGTALKLVTVALGWLAIAGFGILWVSFWGNLARIHLTMGDTVSAVYTVALFVLFPVLVALWRIAGWVDAEMVTDGFPVPSPGD